MMGATDIAEVVVRRLSTLFAVVVVLLLGGAGAAQAEPPFRVPDRVTDRVGALDAAGNQRVRQAIDELRAAGTDLFVVYVDSFDGADGQQWATDTANRSQFGTNDVLLAVATGDRTYGYSFADDYPLPETTTDEVGFFNDFLGAPSQARIGVLRPIEDSKPPKYKLVRQSPVEILNPYFGSTPVFALDHPLTVLKGQVVALTIPTWAPMFALNLSGENTWRGSRLPDHCISREDVQGGHPQQGVGKIKTYGCYYSDARLLYTATLVKKP